MAHRQTPREKKRRSMRELVDVWGESQKSFRRNGPLLDAQAHRSYRRTWNQQLGYRDDAEIAVRRVHSGRWSGTPRAEHLVQRRELAERYRVAPRESPEARARRAARRRAGMRR